MKRRIVQSLFFLCVFCCFQCEKPKEVKYKIYGTISNSINNNPINDAEVRLSAQILNEGTFNNSFQFLETQSTNSEGYYEFNIDKELFNSMKVQFDKELYGSQEEEINPESIDPIEGFEVSMELEPLAFVNLKVKNINPFNDEDQLVFRYTTSYFPQCACCNNQYQYFTGTGVDTVVSCTIIGETQLDYYYSIFRGGASTAASGSQFIESFGTVDIEINY
jgi:hypothetical protein